MRFFSIALVAMIGLGGARVAAQPSPADSAAVTGVVNRFHAALKAGDAAQVMQLLAPDAVLLEGGAIETRAEYEKNHLPADIEFEKVITTVRAPYRITLVGDSAWVITTSEYKGRFQDRPVDSIGVELMVLSRDESATWRIKAIHWSSRARRLAQ